MAVPDPPTTVHDLPDVILSNIFSLITDTRTRNSLSLVCRKYLALERATRVSVTLRGNARDLYRIPTSFRAVTNLDLSLLSPWGHDLLSSLSDPFLLARRLHVAFPLVTSLTIYARTPRTFQILTPQWPRLRHVKLVRWHQPPQSPIGADFVTLFENCQTLETLDLSNFYYYTEDLPPVLQAFPLVSASLSRLDLLTVSFSDGFKSQEIGLITSACCNLKEFLVACTFDPRYIGFIGDQALIDIASNCPKLRLLHLVDTSSLANSRGDPNSDGFTSEDAGISVPGLIDFFSKLNLLEELVLDVCRNVRESGHALEVLNAKCKNLRVLKLGQFHGVVMAIESHLDGLALCQNLRSLSIKNAGDLTDMGLIEIGRGCSKLSKFEVQGCKSITWKGVRTLASLLRKTLVDVSISCCKNLGATASLRAMEPIRDRIQKLHIDCVWDDVEDFESNTQGEVAHGFDLNALSEPSISGSNDYSYSFVNEYDCNDMRRSKKPKCDLETNFLIAESNGNGFWCWDRLWSLSLWIGVGDFLRPLATSGLEDCPNLEEIRIRIEGDCRGQNKPSVNAFGLSILSCYHKLSKLQLDCGDVIGYALTAPSGQMDLSLWERFFLNGIGALTNLCELDYWPPQDRDVNHRSLSLPAAGLLGECHNLRKLFIHGTAHEHFMNFLLRPPSLRDVQLREDYYPAPENDMSTEMRADSCSRFEYALNQRPIDD